MFKISKDYPRAIVHIDGDCFFAACEVMKNPKLKGKPVIIGAERVIVSSLTYEAKVRGVTRGMQLHEVKRICPEVIILPSDYETYSLMSVRMFEIVRRFTPQVEEYSIDECFADITGMQRPMNMSYEKIGLKIKETLDKELGITFSVGLAPTKVLAKIGSKWHKPSGFTSIPNFRIVDFLDQTPIGQVWGIGQNTINFLQKYDIKTANDFANQTEHWVKAKLSKPFYEIWQELRGTAIYNVKAPYQSISKTKTFTPPSHNRSFVMAQLSKNIENACIKLRRHELASKKFFFFLKTQDFKHLGLEIKLSQPTNSPTEVLELIEPRFTEIFNSCLEYRSSGVVMLDLVPVAPIQLDIFGKALRIEKLTKLFSSLDDLSTRYGKHTAFLGSSLKAMTHHEPLLVRNTVPQRQNLLFTGESLRKRISLPFMGEVI